MLRFVARMKEGRLLPPLRLSSLGPREFDASPDRGVGSASLCALKETYVGDSCTQSRRTDDGSCGVERDHEAVGVVECLRGKRVGRSPVCASRMLWSRYSRVLFDIVEVHSRSPCLQLRHGVPVWMSEHLTFLCLQLLQAKEERFLGER